MDFDVLARNLAPNTSRVDSHTDKGEMRAFAESQEKDWDVSYPGAQTSPLALKIAEIDKLIFFRVQFFGGVVEVLARDYEVTRTNEALKT